MTLPLILLAGGHATRMWPETEKIPKSMLPVAGRPFIAHQLELIVKNGISEIVICLGYLGGMIEEYLAEKPPFGLSVRFSYDGDLPLGTGGATFKAASHIESPFFVMYGDSYLTVDYNEVACAFAKSGKPGLMTVYKNKNRWDNSNVVFADGLIRAYSKKNRTCDMDYIDYGLGILQNGAFKDNMKGAAFDLADVYEELALNGHLAGYEAEERFYEVGSREGLRELDEKLSKKIATA